jgi:hypothetical protein
VPIQELWIRHGKCFDFALSHPANSLHKSSIFRKQNLSIARF